ncbi:hypothetical protein ATK78_4068 [Pedobacter metabolipauper]|uniref:Uncharacterized protein n=1 Tax=Pedobacter metabolipauper TaxID=425513 RepID=A0A4R6SRJ2_9SPHI|nr:hypothetical protein ATK78_4068 [Pedobacter metabolipauper]
MIYQKHTRVSNCIRVIYELFYFALIQNIKYICIVKQVKSNTDSKKRISNFVNPFIKMIEDKKRIAETLKEGKSLSTLKEISFVKPI